MKLRTGCLLIGACLLTGCWEQKSVNPFFTTGDIDYDARLVGGWTERKESDEGKEEKGGVWRFSDTADKRYLLEIGEENDGNSMERYDAHLFQLDGHQLLDIVPTARSGNAIPTHHLFKVVSVEPTLQLALLKRSWVQQWLRSHPTSLAHVAIVDPEHRDERDKDELVLTAGTEALQKFLREHWNEAELFAKPWVFKPEGSLTPETPEDKTQ